MKASNPYRQELRSRIVEAATQMFHKHGIKMVKMDDIATSLTISKRTLYEIYDNKEDLVYEVVVQHAVNTGHKVEKLTSPGSNVMDVLINYLRMQIDELDTINPSFFLDLKKYPKCQKYLLDTREIRIKQSLAFFERGVSEGYFVPGLNYEIVQMIGSYAMEGIMGRSECAQLGIKDIFNTIVIVLLRGISTQKGIDVIDGYISSCK